MKPEHIFLIIILIAADLLVIGLLLTRQGRSHSQSCVTSLRDSQDLPSLDLSDYRGQILSTAKLKGSPLVVQFVDTRIRYTSRLIKAHTGKRFRAREYVFSQSSRTVVRTNRRPLKRLDRRSCQSFEPFRVL